MTMMALAYGFIWLAVFGYLLLVGRKVGRLEGELAELRRRMERSNP